ncbi:TPA: GNAT family N-acetyltransferase [Candidatus Bipolaricaulota bacterium]|nr:GNAT family N-acetyltransferase [Candidatus Bipolaricaulota bacterium]
MLLVLAPEALGGIIPFGLRIRRAEERDLPRVMEIERSSFSSPWPETLLRSYLGEEGFMVGEEEGRVVGYILVGLRVPSFFSRLERRTRLLFHRDREEDQDPDLQVGHVMNLAVDPPYRHRGLGGQLLQAGLDCLRRLGARRVELEVRTRNEEAIRLYRRFGFSITRLISRYYSDGDDAYLMVRPL